MKAKYISNGKETVYDNIYGITVISENEICIEMHGKDDIRLQIDQNNKIVIES